MFSVINVDGNSIIDISAVEDPETERLQVTVTDGRTYVFQLVESRFIMDTALSDGEGFEHAHVAHNRVRPEPSEFVIYIPVWDQKQPFSTRQPVAGEWLTVLAGVVNPPKYVGGVRHTMLGGPITEFTSMILQR
jgi:hypothetical protein